MIKNINLKILIVSVLIFIFSIYVISIRFYSVAGNNISKVNIGRHIFYAEVVESDEKKQKGLGGRNDLCEACGMLFKFKETGVYSFWMRGMKFPLDIIWISDNKIIHLEKNIQPDFIGTLTPREMANNVLELNSGIIESFGLKVGDTVNF
jgi:uncharacterized membrane protein (UPF0127 family)